MSNEAYTRAYKSSDTSSDSTSSAPGASALPGLAKLPGVPGKPQLPRLNGVSDLRDESGRAAKRHAEAVARRQKKKDGDEEKTGGRRDAEKTGGRSRSRSR